MDISQLNQIRAILCYKLCNYVCNHGDGQAGYNGYDPLQLNYHNISEMVNDNI